MKTFRYSFLMLLLLAPAMAFAQVLPDSVDVVIGGSTYGAWGAVFGPQFEIGTNIGPLPFVPVEGDGTTAPANQGCDPLLNGDDVAGNIAWISRGSCAFVLKVQNAAAAGAVAVIVFNDDRNGDPDPTLVSMGGDCGPAEGCTIPAAFVSRQSSLPIATDIKFGEEGTIVPIRITAPPPVPTSAALSTGTIETTLFEDGFIGNDASFGNGAGFAFNGTNGLFVGTVLVAIGADVSNNPYDGAPEFSPDQDAAAVAGPYAAPYASFDQAGRAVFSSDQVQVTVTGYADTDSPNDTFIPYDVSVTNISGGDLSDVYIGIFADWDTGATTSTDDAGGFDAATNMPYVFDPAEETVYFGVAASTSASFSGYSTDATAADDADLLNGLSSNNEPVAGAAERAAVTGTGPYSLANGATQTVRFAFVAGGDLTELLANAAAAQVIISQGVGVEETTPAGTFVLESAYPNPLSSKTTIGFELPTAQDVSLVVYDVLGRQVATLVDGTRQAGPQTVEFDASALPSGVYVYRLEAGATQLTQRITIVR